MLRQPRTRCGSGFLFNQIKCEWVYNKVGENLAWQLFHGSEFVRLVMGDYALNLF